ncbi:MAG: Copper Transporter integral membrane protein that functions in high affinity copper transport [Thelocarpon impressellum]|nr:MAG: Copper Transporter integral membrane protein that functions in high affinity copper transport [Thelocarpon impressellum]
MDMSSMSSMMSSTTSATMTMGKATATAAGAAATSAASGGMDMGMGMGGGGKNACKISMLWNWYTIDACFLSRQWHIRSRAHFGGSCVGVILLVLSLELIRRAQRELDVYLRAQNAAVPSSGSESGSGGSPEPTKSGAVSAVSWLGGRRRATGAARPLKLWQQSARSLLYMLQFAVSYFIMLLAMYYNGYIIICIFIGAFLGALVFQWDTLNTVV